MNDTTPEQPAGEETRETLRPTGPRIYVASLSDYNAGRLHGAWIDANQDVEDLHHDVQTMLERSTEPNAEEWAIHDYESFGPLALGEYESLEHVGAIARGIVEHGSAYAHWANYLGSSEWQYLDRFDDCYLGTWDSDTEFAESMLEDMGVDIESLGPESLQPYISFDLDAFTRDLSYDLYMANDEDGCHVFDNM